ncbi:MAG: hypothetical protein NTZ10_05495 [Candidatus Saganbacteria bacterium]|nr:hypothetical protein [Candidatus Saganbacteria bacterium]
MTDAERLNTTIEKIEISGKRYVKSNTSAALSELIKNEAGSFINIISNRFSMGQAPGRTVSYWR